jgi:hypothetical protein
VKRRIFLPECWGCGVWGVRVRFNKISHAGQRWLLEDG